jgi:hypothetical protein
VRELAVTIVVITLLLGSALGSREPGATVRASGSQKYLTTTDNANNAGQMVADADLDVPIENGLPKHPIEFYITGVSNVASGVLIIRAYDVESNEPNADGCGYPETDLVYLNDSLLGSLVGTDGAWSDTSFSISSSQLVVGDNLVKIVVDPDHPSNPYEGCIFMRVDYGLLDLSPPVGGNTELSRISGKTDSYDVHVLLTTGIAMLGATLAAGLFVLHRKQGRGS